MASTRNRSRGALGKLQLLRVLLRTRTWRAHRLRVCVVSRGAGAPLRAVARDVTRWAALDGYPHVVRVPAAHADA